MFDCPPAMTSAVNGGVVSGSAVGGPTRERLEVDPGRRVAHGYRPVKFGGSALGDRGDALVEVGGLAQPLLLLVLARRRGAHLVGEVAAHRLADGEQRERRRRRDLRRERVARPMRSSSAATSRSARPMRNASSPRTSTAVYMSSSACCWPTTAGSVAEMPKPWWNPSLAKLQLKRVSGDATRKSAASERPRPPPDRGALHRGDDRLAVGEQSRRLLVEAWWWRRAGRCPSGRRRRRSSCPRSTARPHGTRVRRRGRAMASASSVITAMSNQLCGGRWISTVATWSARSTETAGRWKRQRSSPRNLLRGLGEPLPPTSRIPDVAGVSSVTRAEPPRLGRPKPMHPGEGPGSWTRRSRSSSPASPSPAP